MVVGDDARIAPFAADRVFRHFNPLTGHLTFWDDRFNLYEAQTEIRRLLPRVQDTRRRVQAELNR